MLAQPFSHEYSSTINSLGKPPAQQPDPPPPSQPPQPILPSSDDLPAHPIIQHYLLNPTTTSTPLTTTATTSLAPPAASDFFGRPGQDRPYFLYCLSCTTPLSDVFHVTDGDDSHVTVDAVYTDAVLSATQPTVLPQHGLYYALSCQRCGSHVGRYYRFTSPAAINKCNAFSLDIQCVGVRLLGSGTVQGERYAEEVGIATRLTQVMLTTAAVREEVDELKRQGAGAKEELERTTARMRRMEQKLRKILGDKYDSDHDELADGAPQAAVTDAASRKSQTAAGASPASTASASTSSTPAKPPAAPTHATPQPGPVSTAKKRGRPSKKAAQAAEEAAFEPAVKRKEKKVVVGDAVKGWAEETEDEVEEVTGQGNPPSSAASGVKRGRPKSATRAPS